MFTIPNIAGRDVLGTRRKPPFLFLDYHEIFCPTVKLQVEKLDETILDSSPWYPPRANIRRNV